MEHFYDDNEQLWAQAGNKIVINVKNEWWMGCRLNIDSAKPIILNKHTR